MDAGKREDREHRHIEEAVLVLKTDYRQWKPTSNDERYYENWDKNDGHNESPHYAETMSDDQFNDAHTDPSTEDDKQAGGATSCPDSMDTNGSPSHMEGDTADEEVTTLTASSPQQAMEEDMLPNLTAPSLTWDDVLHSRPQTPAPDSADVVIMGLNSMQIHEATMEDINDQHSDTSSEAASSISAHIIKSFEDEPPMNNMTEWVKWRAPQLTIPQWMKEGSKVQGCGQHH